MNQKIQQIDYAVQQAQLFKSKLTPAAMEVPFMGSLKIRHLLNNLGSISRHYLEVGSHLGGSMCSAVFANDNLVSSTGIDNGSEFNDDKDVGRKFVINVIQHMPKTTAFHFLEKDCFGVDVVNDIQQNVDLYLWDGPHGYEEHRDGAKHFLPAMSEEFIFCIDDWTFGSEGIGVEEGTRLGIKESGATILKEWILLPEPGILPNDSWHNGYAVFLLKK